MGSKGAIVALGLAVAPRVNTCQGPKSPPRQEPRSVSHIAGGDRPSGFLHSPPQGMQESRLPSCCYCKESVTSAVVTSVKNGRSSLTHVVSRKPLSDNFHRRKLFRRRLAEIRKAKVMHSQRRHPCLDRKVSSPDLSSSFSQTVRGQDRGAKMEHQ